MSKRKILAYSGSRSDLGHLLPVLRLMDSDRRIDLTLVVSGDHLLQGRSPSQLRLLNTRILRVPIFTKLPNAADWARGLGKGLLQLESLMRKIKPDLVLFLGDRTELFCVSLPALLHRIPMAHLHGGEVSTGSTDDLIRHSHSKLASLHFAATAEYQRRLIQMGEDPRRVFWVGAPVLDELKAISRPSKSILGKQLGLDPKSDWVFISYHPATRGVSTISKELGALLAAAHKLKGVQFLITQTNSDLGSDEVNRMLKRFTARHGGRAILVDNLGIPLFWQALSRCQLIMGNSSAGLIEAPSLRVPTLNIGDRQKGRARAPSVFDCSADSAQILKRALELLRHPPKDYSNPYRRAGSARRIKEVVRSFPLSGLDRKPFRDLSKERR